MKAEVLFLLAALVAQHNGLSIPAVYWIAFGAWAVSRLLYLTFSVMAEEVRKRARA